MDEIIRRLNPTVLNVLVAAIALILAVLIVLVVGMVRQAFREGRQIKITDYFVLGPKTARESEPPASTKGAAKEVQPARPYRKVLYVKVTLLGEKAPGAKPFYERVVKRLKESDRTVAVYDEAVYYTLELFPTKRPIESRQDTSTGVVDSQVLIPWSHNLLFHDANVKWIKEVVKFDMNEESDTLFTVSHITNGLQGAASWNMATLVQEDAEYARLIVDFSSVPGAGRFVKARSGWVLAGGREPTPDEVSPDAVQAYGDSIFVLCRNNVAKNSLLKMYFDFDWSLAPSR